MRIVLDTNILGKLCHPKKNKDVASWFIKILSTGGPPIYLPEISDYELRRELLRIDGQESLKRLDELSDQLNYISIASRHMKKAAELWAEVRKKGRPTAGKEALDGDVILAAQALEIGGVVLTENKRHLGLFVEAFTFDEITVRIK